jgi:cyclic di-GMP phosphodiesterase
MRFSADDQDLLGLRILAVGEDDADLLLLRRMLEGAGYANVVTTGPRAAPAVVAADAPDLLALDLPGSEPDGFALLERLATLLGGVVPALVLTSGADPETKRHGHSAGARDFIAKPLDRVELALRVRNLLQCKRLQDRLRRHDTDSQDLDATRWEILDRLALAAEYRDDVTPEHAQRIGHTCGLLAHTLGLSASASEMLRRAAPLHDVGKIGVPGSILLKPGRLDAREFEVIRTHPTIGGEILSGAAARSCAWPRRSL